jgi:hypothetical protein
MGITRARLSIDEHFTAVPNEWARDARLSRRARGLLVEVMSHRVGWHVTIRSLAGAGKEGRDAIQSALNELLEHGYVRRSQGRAAAGKFAEIEYELCDPPTVAGFSVHGSAVSGSAVSGESATKKNISSEEHHSEVMFALDQPEAPSVTSFAEFYMAYPRKVGKEAARRAFERAAKSAAPQLIVDGARRYATDPNLPEKQFIPHPATWLNDGRWDDEPLPPRAAAASAHPSTEDFAEGDEWMAFNR